MKTIPDLIDDIKSFEETKDPWFAFLEHWSIKINVMRGIKDGETGRRNRYSEYKYKVRN